MIRIIIIFGIVGVLAFLGYRVQTARSAKQVVTSAYEVYRAHDLVRFEQYVDISPLAGNLTNQILDDLHTSEETLENSI